MTQLTLKEQIEMKRNPEGFILQKVFEVEKEAEEKIAELTKRTDEAVAEVERLTKIVEVKDKGLDGTDGDDGHTPTKEELLSLIIPLIPKVIDGETPTEEQLLALIQPLIPSKITNAELMGLIEAIMPEIGDKFEETGDEIAGKLNTTKDSVEQYVIKGLKKTLDGFTKSIQNIVRSSKERGGGSTGGGMGNWLHQNTATTSATTTVTITTKVAASGYAMLVRYNGKLLAHNVDYTLNNATHVITFVGFTLEDNTFIDVTWVRA